MYYDSNGDNQQRIYRHVLKNNNKKKKIDLQSVQVPNNNERL
jgi:hypothetical protein